ncbi:MAG: TPM domain-containing protein [Acidobacteria bacterium]|nr:TPM domain-containing protein [Acidobacteriota bacterium]
MRPLARVALLVALAAAAALAVDFGALKPQGYVSDFSSVVEPGARAALERYCAQVERSTGAQIALVTLPTLEGEPIEDVANLLYRKWGVGAKGKNEGVLLLLVINDRRSKLEVGYGLEPILPDGSAGGLLREMRPALRERHYGDALALAARAIGERIAQAKGVQIRAAAPATRQRPLSTQIPWPLLLGGAGLLLWLLMQSRGGGGGGGFLMGMILGNLMGRSFGGQGRGGFGGYDSGDGFGGFGGGDSGGGGASSDW